LGEPDRSGQQRRKRSEQRYEPRLVQFTFNNKKRDKFPTATLNRLGLPRSPKALILVEMRAPLQGTGRRPRQQTRR
jgi:hypothetical protein